jgi:hypothetical protein
VTGDALQLQPGWRGNGGPRSTTSVPQDEGRTRKPRRRQLGLTQSMLLGLSRLETRCTRSWMLAVARCIQTAVANWGQPAAPRAPGHERRISELGGLALPGAPVVVVEERFVSDSPGGVAVSDGRRMRGRTGADGLQRVGQLGLNESASRGSFPPGKFLASGRLAPASGGRLPWWSHTCTAGGSGSGLIVAGARWRSPKGFRQCRRDEGRIVRPTRRRA